MATKIGTAYVDIQPDFSAFGRRLPTTISSRIGGYEKRLAGANTTSSRLSSTTRGLGSNLATAARAAVGAAAAYLSISQAKAAVATTQDLTKSTISLHKNLGIANRVGSEWGAVAQARGVDSNKLGMAFKTLSTQVESARQGSAAAVTQFKALGLSQQDLAKGSKDVSSLIPKLADGMDKLGPGTERTAIAGRLFGRGWQSLAPLMRDGADALNANLKAADDYGAVLHGKTLKAQQELLANTRESKLAWIGLQVQFTNALTPALNVVEDQFQRIARIMADKRLTDDEKFARISRIIQDDLSKALDFLTDHVIPQVAQDVGQAAPKIAGALFQGFINAPALGKLAIGAWFISKLGGWSAITALGSLFGRRMGGAMATSTVETSMLADGTSIPAMLASRGGRFSALGTRLGTLFGTAFAPAAAVLIADQLVHLNIPGTDSSLSDTTSIGGKSVTAPGHFEKPGTHHIGAIPLPGFINSALFGDGGGISAPASPAKGEQKFLRGLQQVWKSADLTTKSGVKDAQTLLHGYVKAWEETGHAVTTSEQQKFDKLTQLAADKLKKFTKAHVEAGVKIVASAGDTAAKTSDKYHTLTKNLQVSVRAWQGAVGGGINKLAGMTNNALNALGLEAVSFAAGTAAKAATKAKGHKLGGLAGVVPGDAPGDRHTLSIGGVPIASVESREGIFVGNRTLMEALDAANGAIPRRQRGGYVDLWGKGLARLARGGVIEQALGPYSIPPIQYDPNHAGSNSHVHADFFTVAQALAYGHKAQGIGWSIGEYTPHPSNPFHFGPITTQHQSPGHYDGTAWDANKGVVESRAAVAQMAKLLGSGVAAGGAAAVEKIKRVLLDGPNGAMKSMGQGAVDHVWHAANKYLAKQAPKMTTGKDFPVGAGAISRQEMRGLLKAHGMPNWTGWIAMAESALNPNAVSSAGARGLFQIMPFWGGGDKLFDPNYNTAKARHILDTQGLTAWNPSRNAGAIPEGWGPHQGQKFRKGGLVRGGDGASAYDFLGYAAGGGRAIRPGLAHLEKDEIAIPKHLQGGGDTYVRVFIGDREITDIVRTELDQHDASNRQLARMHR
jgi:hypothetical protein